MRLFLLLIAPFFIIDVAFAQQANDDLKENFANALNRGLDGNPVSLEEIRTLIKQGADPNMYGYYHYQPEATPLTMAVGRAWVPVAKVLLENGADPNLPDKGQYPSVPLCHIGDVRNYPPAYGEEMAKLLIAHGAKIDTADEHGNTPLVCMIRHHEIGAIKALLNAGAEVQQTALTMALDQGYEDIAILLREKEVKKTASSSSRLENDQKDDKYDSPICTAARKGLLKALETMPRQDKSANACALAQAVEKDQYEAAALLLKMGINPDEPYRNETPLLIAAREGKDKFVELLLANKADLEIVVHYGSPGTSYTNGPSLTEAAAKGHVETVTLLLRHNAKASTEALNRAIGGKHSDVAKVLLDSGVMPDPRALVTAAESGQTEIIKWILDKGLNADSSVQYNVTPLMLAAKGGQVEMIDLLLDHKANIEAVNQPQMWYSSWEGIGDPFVGTPLMWAISSNQQQATELLLKRGAKPTLEAVKLATSGGNQRIIAIIKSYQH